MSDDPRVAEAIGDLRELRSTDPAARSAIHAVQLARLTLECFWCRSEPQPDDSAA